jgi:hypothetical protein
MECFRILKAWSFLHAYGEGPPCWNEVDRGCQNALSPCGNYPDERTGNPNAVVHTRQKKNEHRLSRQGQITRYPGRRHAGRLR